MWPLLLALGLFSITVFTPAESAAAQAEIVVEAPARLQPIADRVESLDPDQLDRILRFVGLEDAGGPVRVLLEPAGSEIDVATPAAVGGFAYGSLGTVVLFPERAPPYPYGSFDEVLLHELAHVYASRAAGHRPVPRWFSEGLAIVAAGTWSLDDRGWLTAAAVLDPNAPLAELEAMFESGRARTARAYALSGAFVRDLVELKGADTVARILRRRRLGLSFDEAFERTVGSEPESAARAFWKRYSLWYRWVPLATSSLTLWIGISFLALWAAARKRRRRELLEELWETEDELVRPPEPREAPPGGWIH